MSMPLKTILHAAKWQLNKLRKICLFFMWAKMRTNKPCRTSNANRGENLHEPFFGGVLFYLFLDPKTPNTSIGFLVLQCRAILQGEDRSCRCIFKFRCRAPLDEGGDKWGRDKGVSSKGGRYEGYGGRGRDKGVSSNGGRYEGNEEGGRGRDNGVSSKGGRYVGYGGRGRDKGVSSNGGRYEGCEEGGRGRDKGVSSKGGRYEGYEEGGRGRDKGVSSNGGRYEGYEEDLILHRFCNKSKMEKTALLREFLGSFQACESFHLLEGCLICVDGWSGAWCPCPDFFPTCQVRVVRFYQSCCPPPPPRPPPPPPPPPPPLPPPPPPPVSPVCTAGPQPGAFPAQCAPLDLNLGPAQLSVHRWTSTWGLPSSVCTAGPQPGTFPAQCAPLDLNLGPAQLSVHRWTSTAR